MSSDRFTTLSLSAAENIIERETQIVDAGDGGSVTSFIVLSMPETDSGVPASSGVPFAPACAPSDPYSQTGPAGSAGFAGVGPPPRERRKFRLPLFVVFALLSLVAATLMQLRDCQYYAEPPDRVNSAVWQQSDFCSPEARQKTMRALNLAAKRGSSKAWASIGYLYAATEPQDPARSKQAYERAIRAGNPIAMHNLAVDYESGIHGPGTLSSAEDWAPYRRKAFELYQQAAFEKGYGPSMMALSNAYLHGTGVSVDEKKAFYWARRAAEKGEFTALSALAFYYEIGIGVSKDTTKALPLLERALNYGSTESALHLGTLHLYGRGIPVDYRKAFHYYSIAAARGESAGRVMMGRMYQTGLGVRQDDTKARQMYDTAYAESGSAEALLRRALLDRKNTKISRLVVDQDLNEALDLLKSDASYGHGWSTYLLGQCYEHGWGIKRDMTEAVRLYRDSASMDQYEAALRLKQLGQPLPHVQPYRNLDGITDVASYSLPY